MRVTPLARQRRRSDGGGSDIGDAAHPRSSCAMRGAVIASQRRSNPESRDRPPGRCATRHDGKAVAQHCASQVRAAQPQVDMSVRPAALDRALSLRYCPVRSHLRHDERGILWGCSARPKVPAAMSPCSGGARGPSRSGLCLHLTNQDTTQSWFELTLSWGRRGDSGPWTLDSG